MPFFWGAVANPCRPTRCLALERSSNHPFVGFGYGAPHGARIETKRTREGTAVAPTFSMLSSPLRRRRQQQLGSTLSKKREKSIASFLFLFSASTNGCCTPRGTKTASMVLERSISSAE